MSLKITKTHFTGNAQLFRTEDAGLSDILRKLAQDIAKQRVATQAVTDNSTGTASGSAIIVEQKGGDIPAYTKAGTDCAPKAGFDTAIGKVENAQSCLVEVINDINASLGLPAVTDNASGTITTPGTIPALDKSLTAVASSCLDVTTGKARLAVIKSNTAAIVGAANRIATALGVAGLVNNLGANHKGGTLTIENIAASGTATDGTLASSLADAAVDAELTAVANNVATIAAFLDGLYDATLNNDVPLVVAFDA